MLEKVARTLEKVREQNPLIHNITNRVVTNFTANGLLALGASPVMAHAKEEVAEMAKLAGAVVLNMGTPDEAEAEAMVIAGQSANQHGVPVLFDPVGAGATSYRLELARRIMREVKVDIVRGNAGEIANLIGEAQQMKGVDSTDSTQDIDQMAVKAAEQLGTIVAVTGKVDIITDGRTVYRIENGDPILTKVTGTGCLLTSVMGAFAAVERDFLTAGAAALVSYGVAAEKAARHTINEGPGSFQIQFVNELSKVTSDDVKRMGAVSEVAQAVHS
ncbi:hydroxyethylthiazole kinase [Brevibacillus sp. TJ4]|uniref:hydroxyethylthiazole kinase n=1 Tax=Brevibacillus sp. TJ4 TaxID=3234853 RepID=UPI0037D7FFA2